MVWLIKKDGSGNEIERKVKGRGRPPRNYKKHEDGNWYYHSPWKQPKPEETEEQELKAPKRIKRIEARNKTTVASIAKACSVLKHDVIDGLITLHSPILTGQTGLQELDDLYDGDPVFHRIEINKNEGTVSVWSITSPAGPFLVIEKALTDMGEDNAVAET